MGITIVQKSDLSRPKKRNARVALVLAGGAISGGAFKLGGLMALSHFLQNRRVTDFDIYVGLSAGAFLAAPLSAGIPPEELMRSLTGESEKITQFRPWDFYVPNYKEFVGKPAKLVKDAVAFGPQAAGVIWRYVARHSRELRALGRRFAETPTTLNLERLLTPVIREVLRSSDLPHGFSYLPAGLFDNSRIEKFIRKNLERNGLPNNFRLLHLDRGSSLYISATNLNTAQGVVFGHDEDTSATISEAVQASTAIPGFFKPARINGVDYLDAGVRKTANISTAVRKGADLVIAYNPFRPFANFYAEGLLGGFRSIGDMGMVTVLNQAFRMLLHSRLRLGIEKLRLDNNFRGDVILIEPTETDSKFFEINPLDFWKRADAAEHGFMSTKESLERHYPQLVRIFRAYDLEVSLDSMREAAAAIRTTEPDDDALLTLLEPRPVPNQPLRVVR